MAVAKSLVLLCLVVVLAESPQAALGNCRNECNAACNGWIVMCQISCASACIGEVGISTLSTTTVAAPPKTSSSQAPAAAPQQEGVLKDLSMKAKP